MMSIGTQTCVQALLIGMTATAALDLWALLLNRSLGLPITNWGHVGRWVAGIPAGTFRHVNIEAAPRMAGERIVGWLTHYLIGVIYAALYLMLLMSMSQTPGLGSAALFGIVTVFAPWLILQPGLGAGYFARNTPKPNLVRALNLLSHFVFGLGLYLGWNLLVLVERSGQ